MGLPVDPQKEQQSSSNGATNGAATPTSVDQLPPAAIELAEKLFDFARHGKTAELQQYLSAGIPANLTNAKGDTLLMLAAYHGQVETLRALLDKGSDPNVLNDRGQSPLAGAVFKGHDEVVRMLFANGANTELGQPNAVDSARMFKKEEYLQLFGVEA